MSMSDYGRVIHQTQVGQIAAAITGIVNGAGGDMSAWQAPITNFGQVLNEIREGVPDEVISRNHPGWRGDVLKVCHMIVDGTLTQPAVGTISDEQHKQNEKLRKKRERKQMARYRKRYGKG